jgi:predicted N-acetyltransferase YhbS
VEDEEVTVGFSLLESVDGVVYLAELDVHPAHGRRGSGSALVRASCDWAVAQGFRASTLSSWRVGPGSGPCYRGLGFEEIPEGVLRPQLAAILRAQVERGLARQYARCTMRRRLVP